MNGRAAALALAGLLVLSGCAGLPGLTDGTATPAPTTTTDGGDGGPVTPGDGPPDPSTDRIGWEDGYWYNETIAVDQSDGLSDAELRAYVGRAMARVEHIREREFTERVPVSVLSREEYRNRSGGGSDGQSAYAAWNDQVWEALLIVGEDRDTNDEIDDTRSSAVLGFYDSGADEIKIITDTPEQPTIANATLAHELVHALQDQHYNLSASRFGGDTQDAQLATSGLIEGDANYVEALYAARCRGEWECVTTSRSGGGGGSGGGRNLGILLTLLQPYSDGPVWVHHLREAGGWDAVDDAYAAPPATSEQVIHLTDDPPEAVDVADRGRNGWSQFGEGFGRNGTDTVGEASIYVMFWYQGREYGASAIDWRTFTTVESRYDSYRYVSDPSAGWAGDAVAPYRNGDEFGYVWKTRWDTETDARQFREAYVSLLRNQGTAHPSADVWVVEQGPFADAFRVVRENRTVTVTNGPTAAALEDVRPTDGSGPPASTGDGLPGPGPLGAVSAVLLAGVLVALARRRGGGEGEGGPGDA